MKITEMSDIPWPDPDAPLPIVAANDLRLCLIYWTQDGKMRAVIEFQGYCAHKFGPPNDETLHGHPLYAHGLRHYGIFLIEGSPWIQDLEAINRVHPYHNPDRFMQYRHYVWTFHDSTFECVAIDHKISLTDEQSRPVIQNLSEWLTKK